jgi:hypothetical protein
MQALIQKHKNLFLAGGIFVLLGGGYYVFFGTTGAPDSGSVRVPGGIPVGPGAGLGEGATPAFTPENARIETELVSELLRLRSIKLDNRIFTDVAFQSLEDFGQELVAEPIGRINPFAPVGTQ